MIGKKTTLGLVSNSIRNIQPGTEYNAYFPSFSQLEGTDLVLSHGDVFATLQSMEKVVQSTLSDTKKIAKKLKGKSLEETLKNIWEFSYHYIQYAPDKEGIEQIRRPLRTWKDRKSGVDCDCYTILISSILTNLQIPHSYRMTKYDADWQHVYVVVPKAGGNLTNRNEYFVIDPVVDAFNDEVPFTQKFDRKMKMPIQYLNGVPSQSLNNANLSAFGIDNFGNEFDHVGIQGLKGTGESVYQAFLAATKKHLTNTLKYLDNLREPTIGGYEVSALKAQIKRALLVWDNEAARKRILAQFAAEEEILSLNGLGFIKRMWNGIKKGAEAVGKGIKKGAEAVGKAAKDVGQAIARYNPVSLAARGGLATYFKLNLGQSATKLGYGYLTKKQAESLNLEMNEYNKALSALRNTRNMWKDVLKGEEDKLRVYILEGWQKGVKKNNLPSLPISVIKANPLDVTKSATSKPAPIKNFSSFKRTDEKRAASPVVRKTTTSASTFTPILTRPVVSTTKISSPTSSRTTIKPSIKRPTFSVSSLVKNTPTVSSSNRFSSRTSRLRGLGAEPVTATAGTAAASGFIAKIVGWIKNIDLKKIFKGAKKAASNVVNSKVVRSIATNRQVQNLIANKIANTNRVVQQATSQQSIVSPSTRTNTPVTRDVITTPSTSNNVPTATKNTSSSAAPLLLTAGAAIAALLFGVPTGLAGAPTRSPIKKRQYAYKKVKNKTTLGRLPEVSF
ncbi:MAG: transglutaminase-like domain-containing protein [Bacteroidota bacterium]